MSTTRNTNRLAVGACGAILSVMALAGPAQAQFDPDPRGCAATDTCGLAPSGGTSPGVTTSDDTNTVLSLALGAVGGLAVAGAGVAAASSLQRRRQPQPSRAR